MKDKRNRHGTVGKLSSEQHFRKCTAITFIDRTAAAANGSQRGHQ